MAKKTFNPVNPNVNFPEMEEKWLKKWGKDCLVKKYLNRNKNSPKKFSFLDGPITANNPMGVHHAWGRTYKDLWQRYFTMRGFAGRYQNGFDCQGLWVEVEVEKELGIRNKQDIENLVPGDRKKSIAKFVRLCKERVEKFSRIQSQQSQRLGYFMDWDHSYYTMSPENNYMIWHFLKTCHQKGWIYKGNESVPWCPRCQTAISQHEMLTEDYKEVTHTSIYMLFPVSGRKNEYLLVWTTTPWTIPANIAVAVDRELDYSLVLSEGSSYWLASDLVDQVFRGLEKKVVRKVKGSKLAGLKYRGAFDMFPGAKQAANNPLFHTVVVTDPLLMPVTVTEGTGMVHTAVSAGAEDFKLGKKLGLPMIPVIADNADYLDTMGELTGKNAKKHPEIIFNYLENRQAGGQEKWIFKLENYKHRYPSCWRCKTELVWKVASEWYIAMDKPEQESTVRSPQFAEKKAGNNKSGKTLREQMKQVARKIKWHPDFGLERELDWLSNMHDWLISKKNRYWGLALPIYECEKCSHFEIIGSLDELKEKAVSGWDKFEGHSPHKPYIDEVKIKCPECRQVISRIDDVGNVWLDAGIVPFSTYIDPDTGKLSYTTDKEYWSKWFPADFITESFPGQFKNWFYSMIAMSTVLEKTNPYKTVLGFASMLGEDGRPMHKSWGNAVEFNEGAGKIGVDVMRWMFATHDPEQNLLFGYKKADITRRSFHLMLWNVYNFFVTYANIDKYGGLQGKFSPKLALDRWILSKLNRLVIDVGDNLDRYDAFHAAGEIQKFVGDLSQWYVRRIRSRVGPTVTDSDDKNDCHHTLFIILETLSLILEPFTPFLAEEIYTNITGETSVHLADWPQADGDLVDTDLEKMMNEARMVAEVGHSGRKKEKIKVRQPLNSAQYEAPDKLPPELEEILELELNIKKISYSGVSHDPAQTVRVILDTRITAELSREGLAREAVRFIQTVRKEKRCKIDDTVEIVLDESYRSLPDSLIDYIKKETLASKIIWGKKLEVLTG